MANTDFKVLIQAVLDSKSIGKSDIAEIQRVIEKYHLNLTADLNKAEIIKSVRQVIPQLEAELKKAAGINIKINDSDILKAINQIEKQTAKAAATQEKYTNAMARGREQAELQRRAEEKRQQIAQANSVNKAQEEEYRQRQRVLIKTNEQIAKIRELQSSQKLALDFKKTSNSYLQLEQLHSVSQNLKTDFEKLSAIYKAVGPPKSDSQLIANFSKFESLLRRVNNEIEITKAETKGALVPLTQMEKITFSNQIKAWRKVNSAAEKEFGETLNDLLADLDKIDKKTFSQRFGSIKAEASAIGALGKDFSTTIKSSVQKFAEWTFSSGIYMYGINAIKEMLSNVHELDDALVNINYTMDVSSSQLKKIGDSSIGMAKDLNTSVSNVLGAVKLYANAKETADSIIAKAQPAIMISNVSGMTGESAAKMLQSVMNQFDLTQDDLMQISDTIQAVSQNMAYDFAAGIQEIASGIERSGSVAKSAGLDLQEYSSMLGLVIEQTGQSGDTIGNAYKTIFQRITKASSTEGTLAEDISAAEKSLRSVGVEVRDASDEFRDLTAIMADLGRVWDTLSSVQQSNISYNVAGIRQTNILKSLLQNWTDYESLVEKANNSSGVTIQNQEKYATSLSGKLGELGAVWQSIGDNAVNSAWLKMLVDIGIAVSNIVDKVGLLPPLLASIGGFELFKNLDWLTLRWARAA